MKLLVFSTNGVKRDGITLWLIQYFTAMRKGDLTVDTIAFDNSPEDLLRQLESANVTVRVLPSRKRHPLLYMQALRHLLKEQSYNIIHVNGNSGTIAIDLLCCIGTAVTARIVHSRNTRGEFPVLDKLLRPVMNRLTTDRFACGKDAGKWLFGDASFTVVPNSKDFRPYSFNLEARNRARNELGISDKELAIVHVGSLNEQKNHRFLIDAFVEALSLNPGLRLFLLGDGPLRSEIEGRAKGRHIADRVHFLGRTNRVAEYLNAFDLAVLPSLYEGFPNVVIEWQINGLPSLISSSVTDECAVTDMVSILPAGDKNVWGQAMADATSTDRACASTEAQRLLHAAGYEVHDSAEKMRALYEEIMTRSAKVLP